MKAYILGLLTAPTAVFLSLAVVAYGRRSNVTQSACDACGRDESGNWRWVTHPSESRLPWWISDGLRWRLHCCSRMHRAALDVDTAGHDDSSERDGGR